MTDQTAVLQMFVYLQARAYTPPAAPDLLSLAVAYAEDLADLADEEVASAGRLFVRSDVYGKWPTPGALRAALGSSTDWAAIAYGSEPTALPERYQRPAIIAAAAAARFGDDAEASRRKAHREAFAGAERLIQLVLQGAAPPQSYPLTGAEIKAARIMGRRLAKNATKTGRTLGDTVRANMSRLLSELPQPIASASWAAQAVQASLDEASAGDSERRALLADLQRSTLLLGGA